MDNDARLIEIVERTRYRAALRGANARAFGAEWLATEGPPVVVTQEDAPFLVERYFVSDLHVAITSGLGAKPQALGTAEEANERIELAVVCPRMGPRLVRALSMLACTVHVPGRTRPVRAWDRLTFIEPIEGGFAGAIVKWLAEVEPLPGSRVHIYDLLPITSEELARFRREPEAHGQWVDERLERQDYTELHCRWERMFDE